jgi:hypothetical protein
VSRLRRDVLRISCALVPVSQGEVFHVPGRKTGHDEIVAATGWICDFCDGHCLADRRRVFVRFWFVDVKEHAMTRNRRRDVWEIMVIIICVYVVPVGALAAGLILMARHK